MGGDNVLWDDFTLVDDFYEDDNVAAAATTQGLFGNTNEASLLNSPSTLSPNQERVLSTLLVISATLSALGSASIIYKILRDKQLIAKPYHRTMLALSLADVIASLTFGLYPFLMPFQSRIWSFGNATTCTTLGFLTQLSFAAIGYNCILSFYYLLAIRFNLTRKKFSQRYEKPMHFVNLAFFLTTASVGAVYRFYSAVDVGMGCWVNNWPGGCNLTGDCVSQQIAILFAGLPVCFFFLAIVVNNLIVYRHVRTIFNSLDKVYLAQEEKEKKKSSSSSSPSSQSQHGLTAREAIAVRRVHMRSELYDQQLHQVAIQASWYVGSFLLCYTPALATRLVETFTYNYDDAKIYWLLVITAMTLPLQGFFNMFIYNRPHYIKIREAHPNFGKLKAMHAAFLESKSLSSSKSSANSFPPRKPRHAASGGRGKAKTRFSDIGGSLAVVMEEGSQFSSSDEEGENDGEKLEATSRTENTAMEHENDHAYYNDYDDDNNDNGEEEKKEDLNTNNDTSINSEAAAAAPMVHDYYSSSSTPAAGIDMAGTVSVKQQQPTIGSSSASAGGGERDGRQQVNE
mmetsp:Transcript_23073/g.56913  ORF Transcript_23073/g.56913 Transcript_23073/m.56913 type:complete len:570 (-) Transcript_23073:1281-2990(-)